jgi:probable FeS assembly SUF system protein SufT
MMMHGSSGESVTLTRDTEAVRIPSGEAATLREGSHVIITQKLGGSFTLYAPGEGGLFRVKGSDADALGMEPPAPHQPVEGEFREENVWAQLRECYDPEIPVNIVDLGLIYSVEVADAAEGSGKDVRVQMTLTAPGCGMGPSLAADAEARILTVPGVAHARVELVWDPPWSPERISEAGKERLGME